jgi:uncharacterized ParB-like nuclease family protein
MTKSSIALPQIKKPLPPIQDASQMVARVFPNPSTSTIQAEINLSENENIDIEIIDVSGNITKPAVHTNLQKGKNIVTINTNGLRAGLYQLKVISKNKTGYQSFIIVK